MINEILAAKIEAARASEAQAKSQEQIEVGFDNPKEFIK